MARKEQFVGLTGLRGVGAVSVFVFHAAFSFELPVLRDGYLGVDLFFMLSGFVLCYAHSGPDWPLGRYWRFVRTRFARIFPMHLAALAVTLLVVTSWPGFVESFGARAANKFTPAEFVASAFLMQNWGLGEAVAWNVPAWSLSAEWLASLAFPCFAVGAARVTRASAAVALGLLAIAAFLAFLFLTHNPNPGVTGRAGLVRLVLEFAAGALTYRAYALGYRAGRLAGIAALCCLVAGLCDSRLVGLVLFAIPTTILLAAQSGNLVSRALSTGPLRLIGEVSYSFYLLHWIVLMMSVRIADSMHVAGWSLVAWDAALFYLLLGLATMTYTWIEMPARDALRPRKPQIAPEAGGGLEPPDGRATA